MTSATDLSHSEKDFSELFESVNSLSSEVVLFPSAIEGQVRWQEKEARERVSEDKKAMVVGCDEFASGMNKTRRV